jgi:hypothetical protein
MGVLLSCQQNHGGGSGRHIKYPLDGVLHSSGWVRGCRFTLGSESRLLSWCLFGWDGRADVHFLFLIGGAWAR